MVALVREGVDPGELTAITFTRKAAGEMQARFYKELRKTRHLLPEESAEFDRVSGALRRVQSTFIGTIHSFCSRLLRERPLAAGLPPDFSAGLEDRDERALREKAWRRHLQSLHETDEGRRQIRQLSECGVDPQNLGAFFERLCSYAELEPVTSDVTEPPNLDRAVKATVGKIEEWDGRRPGVLPKGRDPAMEAIDHAKRFLSLHDLDHPRQQAEFLKIVADIRPGSRGDIKNTYWAGEEIDNKAWARKLRDGNLEEFQEDTVLPALRQWEAYVHQLATKLAAPAVQRYRELRMDEGMLTFHDLLTLTRDLLRDQPQVRREVQQRYPRLLVDEFQDTDPLQAEILSFLASQDPSQDTWTACRPRDGSLFIVGDDKQSIYRFRRADMNVFDSFRRRIDAETNGEAVDLTKNFRSRKPICAWCNDAFDDIFSAEKYEDLQADYVSFDPQRPEGPDGTAIRRKPIEKVYGNYGSSIAREDASQIARFIEGARGGEAESGFYRNEEGAVFPDEVSYSDFLILTRTKTRLGVYADVLAAHGIPHTITGSEDLGESRELRTIVDLLRAALRPDDPIAAIAYLKGALAGFSDDDLYRLRQAGIQFDRIVSLRSEDRLEDVNEDLKRRTLSALRRLRDARAIIKKARPGVGIEEMIEETGLLAGAALPSDPSNASIRAGAVLRIISYVQHLGADGLGWGEITEELDRILQGDDDLDGMTLETGKDDAVRIMNVHQAKGLEAPVVFLADPYTSGPSPEPDLHLRRENDQIVVPVVQGEGNYQKTTHAPDGWHEGTQPGYKEEEKRHEEAENRRLLYVATTRAERLLVVSTYPEKPEDGYWSALYPPLNKAGVPELDVPGNDKPESHERSAEPERRVSPSMLSKTRADRQKRLAVGRKASYNVQSVTDSKREQTDTMSPNAEEGYGRAFGTAVHELFEMLIQHRANPPKITDAAVRSYLKEKGADVSGNSVDAAHRMLDGFRSSWVWEDLTSAKRVLTEYPFTHVGEQIPESEPEKMLLRGTIDLLYRKEEGWVIVDFKTDRIDATASNPDDLLEADHAYRKQIRAYANAWQDLSGETVVGAGLWMTDVDDFIVVKARPPKVG
jgi:ATP-dependent helicase/nuclease subunit A